MICDARFEVLMTVLWECDTVSRWLVVRMVTLSVGDLFPLFWRHCDPSECCSPLIQQYSITSWTVWILSAIQVQFGKYLLHVLCLFCGIFRRLCIKFDVHNNDFQCCKFVVSWEKHCFMFRSLWRWEVAGSYKMLLSVYQTVWCHIQ
jgi:hypothetical protein